MTLHRAPLKRRPPVASIASVARHRGLHHPYGGRRTRGAFRRPTSSRSASRPVRVVVVGATGNIGTSVVEALRDDHSVERVIGLARRAPRPGTLGIEWRRADIAKDDLGPHFRGADAVIHLAWQLQPARQSRYLHEINVVGSKRVLDAVAAAGVRTLLYASSTSVYAGAPTGTTVDEAWPLGGVPASTFSQQKLEIERMLDRFTQEHQFVRVVRFRSPVTLKPAAASEFSRQFIGAALPFLASPVVRRRYLPDAGLSLQVVHSDDVAAAFRAALLSPVAGAFNLAGTTPVDAVSVAERFRMRRFTVGINTARTAMSIGWALHLLPSEPGWLDLIQATPHVDTSRAEAELGWSPEHAVFETLDAFSRAVANGTGFATIPLVPGPALGRGTPDAGRITNSHANIPD